MNTDYGDVDAMALDGNAAAGFLSELFAFDVTTAMVTCGGCHQAAAAATARVYGGTMGAVFRCAHCNGVVMRFARTPKGYFLDLQGAQGIFVSA